MLCIIRVILNRCLTFRFQQKKILADLSSLVSAYDINFHDAHLVAVVCRAVSQITGELSYSLLEGHDREQGEMVGNK